MKTNVEEREKIYLYLAAMFIILPTGYGINLLFGMLVAISAMFVTGGFLVFLRTIMTIKFAELEIHLRPVLEGNE
jgi:hypothetical protein